MHDDDRPAHFLVVGQDLGCVGDLFLVDVAAAARWIVGVEQQEKDVAIEEVIKGSAELALPVLVGGGSSHVVVAGHVEEWHLQLVDEAVEFLPLRLEDLRTLVTALDQVAHRHHKSRLQQVELLDRLGEDVGPMAASAVADEGELKIVIVRIDFQMADRIAFFQRET